MYRYIYGPVSSWALGRSLGIDPVSSDRGKVCAFDCIYCQIGKTAILSSERKVFAPASKIIEEIKALPALEVDYITFSGAGEPTLAENLGRIIREVKKIRKEKIAVLTNAGLIDRKDVQEDLALADLVVAKFDAAEETLFTGINKPANGIKFERIVKGLKEFRLRYKGKLALRVMCIKENKGYAEDIARLAALIKPDEIQINTALRPCGVKPLAKKELDEIKKFFSATGGDMNIISVYDAKKKKTTPVSKDATLRRRGKL